MASVIIGSRVQMIRGDFHADGGMRAKDLAGGGANRGDGGKCFILGRAARGEAVAQTLQRALARS